MVLASPLSEALQQLLAQPLPLKSLQLPRFNGYWSYRLPALNLALLTKLTELNMGSWQVAEASVLPAQLQQLQFSSWAGADSMAPLTRLEPKQLQHLRLRVDFEQPQLLLQLAQLPALKHLALQYDGCCEGHPAAATASAWALLPQLHELEIAHYFPPSQPQWEAILAGAAAATGLTKLVLDARMVNFALDEAMLNSEDGIEEAWATEVAACAGLNKLTCLQDLTVGGHHGFFKVNMVRGDALALTALTGLTRLVLFRAAHGVGTTVATALALNLKQLQSLDLGYCCLQLGSAEGSTCLEAVGCLTKLTQLSLSGCEGLTQHGLMQLTGLSRLQRAACECMWLDIEVTQEGWTAFWAAVHAQRL
jgi:hypothetical protein